MSFRIFVNLSIDTLTPKVKTSLGGRVQRIMKI